MNPNVLNTTEIQPDFVLSELEDGTPAYVLTFNGECHKCGMKNHHSKDCIQIPRTIRSRPGQTCRTCGSSKHHWQECNYAPQTMKYNAQTTEHTIYTPNMRQQQQDTTIHWPTQERTTNQQRTPQTNQNNVQRHERTDNRNTPYKRKERPRSTTPNRDRKQCNICHMKDDHNDWNCPKITNQGN